MRKLLSILFYLFTSQLAFGDEHPCWCEFSIYSKNKLFRADIEFNKVDSLLNPGERRWSIKVYETKEDTVLRWSSEFYQDGYGGGILSEDGQIYIYINDWLDMEEPPNQVVIYTPEKSIRFSGKDLKLDPTNYSYTVSHQIWMKEYELVPNYFSDSTYLIIKTDDFKNITIDLKSSKIEHSSQTPKFTKENRMLKKLIIGMLIFIGLGIVFIFVIKRN